MLRWQQWREDISTQCKFRGGWQTVNQRGSGKYCVWNFLLLHIWTPRYYIFFHCAFELRPGGWSPCCDGSNGERISQPNANSEEDDKPWIKDDLVSSAFGYFYCLHLWTPCYYIFFSLRLWSPCYYRTNLRFVKSLTSFPQWINLSRLPKMNQRLFLFLNSGWGEDKQHDTNKKGPNPKGI